MNMSREAISVLKVNDYSCANCTKESEQSNTQSNPDVQRCLGGVVSRDGLGLGRIGAPGYRAHRSVAMAPMFKGIRFGRHHFCSKV